MWGMQAAPVASLSLLVELSGDGGQRGSASLGSRSRGQKRGEGEGEMKRLRNGRRQAGFFLTTKRKEIMRISGSYFLGPNSY